jgi:hypothetical protein
LLRDSHHAGVSYGQYDLARILDTITLCLNESDDPVIAIGEGGLRVAEALIIARYMMFTQVYYHKTRAILDHHVENTLSHTLHNPVNGLSASDDSCFPLPTSDESLEAYLRWDDWAVFGAITGGLAGEHGNYLLNRRHFREVLTPGDLSDVDYRESVESRLAKFDPVIRPSSRTWYDTEDNNIMIAPENEGGISRGTPLSQHSKVVEALSERFSDHRLYVKDDFRDEASEILRIHE